MSALFQDISIVPTHAPELQALALKPKTPQREHFQSLVHPAKRGFFGRASCRPQGRNGREPWESQVEI